MTDTKRYIAFVEADAGITIDAESKEQAKAALEEQVRTGHLGPPKVRNVEVDNANQE